MTRAFHDQQIRQYLLGDLPAQDESALEEAYFRDADLLARVELARDDLADDYASARLSGADREKFERRMLTTDEGREQLAISSALRRAETGAFVTARRPAWRTESWWLGLAAAVLLAVGALLAWRIVSAPVAEVRDASARPNAQPTPLGGTPNAPGPGNPQAPSSAAPAITLATLVLTADLERSQGVPPTLLTSTGATHVDLIVPKAGLTVGQTRARIESVEGASIWSGTIDIPSAEAADQRPRARVALSTLPPGDYLLSIESFRQADPTAAPRYFFRVRPR